ncbi:MAG: hypothetical protein HS126_31275 [Anaerolineales bacterium]|nr:hypothetical protein [Anaerolineales bacterium]
MIPVGYRAKRVSLRPDQLQAEAVVDINSVSNCISKNFANYIPYWQHNGYWLFDSPEIIRRLANEHAIELAGTRLFYYEVYELQFDEDIGDWIGFEPELGFPTAVVLPTLKNLEGFDVVTFSAGTSAECSPLSCNYLAGEVETNSHCLLASLEQAQHLLVSGRFTYSEPGPFRIFAVYSVEWP